MPNPMPRLRNRPAGSGDYPTAGVRAVDAYIELGKRVDRLCRAIDGATKRDENDASVRTLVDGAHGSGKISSDG
jgi:hypothetical protein